MKTFAPLEIPDLDTVIIDTVGSIVVVVDRQGRILRFNAAGTRILGYQPDEVLGKVIWDLLPPPEYRATAMERTELLFKGETMEFPCVWLTRDGQPKHLSFVCKGAPGPSGRIEYAIGSAIDITENVTAEQALRESEERFRTTFDDAAIGIALVNEAGQYLHVNRAFCALTGYSEDELVKMRMLDITHPDDREGNWRKFRQLLDGEIHSYVFEKRYVTRAGETVWVQVSSSLASGGVGKPATLIGLFQDISERKRHQQLLEAHNEMLDSRVRERTAALQARTEQLAISEALFREQSVHYRSLADSHLRLAHEVEHRVRNNLQGLLGLVAAMRDKAPSAQAFADAMEARLSAMQHVHQLLAQTQWTPIGLRTLVDGTLATLSHMAPYPAITRVTGPDTFVTPRQILPLTVVLVEWFTNSCKYGPHSVPGGNLDIRWDLTGESGSQHVRLCWTERGGPPVRGPITPSLGTELVQAYVRHELAGECELRYPEEGADHVIEFGVSEE